MSVDDKKPTIIGQMRSFAGKHWAKLSGLDQMERVLAVTTWLAVTSFVMLAMLMDPVISGDGHYYFGMIRGFATHGSPALTEDVAAFVQGQTGRTLGQATFTTADGSVFGIHFFFYSLLCVPAYWLLDMLGMDTLKAFQLTNAFMISAALASGGISLLPRPAIRLGRGACCRQFLAESLFDLADRADHDRLLA